MSVKRIDVLILSLLSLVVFAFLFHLGYQSPGLEGGMDSYEHYLIARYSWVHPKVLMLDQWGKPLYNILASPFAQFGLMGVVTFNILLLIGSAWLAFASAKKLNLRFAWVAFVLCISSPIWFDNTISGLTEPLNAFLLILMFYLFVSKRIVAASILAGFLPYARSEGFVIMAVVGFYLLFVIKEYRAFALLLVGSVFMNFLGWIIEGEALWIYTKNPYIKYQLESAVKKENICGHGSLFDYANKLTWIMGKIRLALFLLGSALVTFMYLRNPKNRQIQQLFYLAFGVYALYFFIHSWIWYKGIMGSCGYERVLVVIAPLAAMVMTYPMSFIMSWGDKILTKSMRRLGLLVVLLIAGYMLYTPVKIYGHKYPIDISDEQKLFVEAAKWYNAQDYDDRMKYFLYPYFNILTDIDPRDTDKFIQLWSFDADYAPVGSIVIWDGHFGPNEGNVPLELLQNHPDFKEIKSFYPEKAFKTLNDYNFEIHVFERVGDSQLK